jgi:tyrosine decarboxylase/aspartate 1-decarboxylase
MEDKGTEFKRVMARLEQAQKSDHSFSDGRVLGSMCTSPLEIAKKAHTLFVEANLGNPGLYPGTKKLEEELIKMFSTLLHGSNIYGSVVSGGTEANITALWIARNLTKKKDVIFPKSAHFSFKKACDLLNLNPIMVDLDDEYGMCVDSADDKISEQTAAVICVAGTTELGVIDPIEELSDLCCEKTFLHVDAAFGGFVLPFLRELGYEVPKFDFELDGVCSLAIDAHKMGMAMIPSGALLLRDRKYLQKIAFESPYLTTMQQTSLLSTRCSASIASTYAVMRYLGMEGYKRIVKSCMDVTKYLVQRIKEMGLTVVIEPKMNIVGIKLRNAKGVYDELNKKDWKTSLARYPQCLRIVVMPHVTIEVIDNFIPDLEETCKALGEI